MARGRRTYIIEPEVGRKLCIAMPGCLSCSAHCMDGLDGTDLQSYCGSTTIDRRSSINDLITVVSERPGAARSLRTVAKNAICIVFTRMNKTQKSRKMQRRMKNSTFINSAWITHEHEAATDLFFEEYNFK